MRPNLCDLARYRQETDQAQTYYKHAAQLVPYNGNVCYLALIVTAKSNPIITTIVNFCYSYCHILF